MRNHRRYEVKKGRMMPRRQRSAATSGGNTTQLPNIDSDVEEDRRVISMSEKSRLFKLSHVETTPRDVMG